MNQEQVVELLNVCIRNGKTAEAPGILMIRIGEELAAVCAGYYQHAELPTESVLNRYENMRPDDAQLRRALDRLLAVPSVVCRRDDMAKKNIDKPFNAPLRTWEQKRSTIGMEEYWQIALLFLQFLHEELLIQ